MKLNIHLPYYSEVLLLGIYPREMKTYVHRKACMLVFIAALFSINHQKLEKTQLFQLMNKQIVVYPYRGILFHDKTGTTC